MNRIAALLHHPVDIVLRGDCGPTNPFFAEAKGIFAAPSGRRIVIPAFYAGGDQWRIRFSPTEEGVWKYELRSPIPALDGGKGEVNAAANPNTAVHGALRLDEAHPHHFVYEDGTRCFVFAYEADWLWAIGLGDPQARRIAELLDTIRPYGFNYILVNAFAWDTRWCRGKVSELDYGPAPAIPWEGTYDAPDYGRLNLAYFENFDRMMSALLERGFIAHVYFRVYNKYVNWPANGSLEDDLYFRYITARYQAYPNLVWDFSKESYNEPDKRYLAGRLALVRALDGYSHLVTVHDDPVFYGSSRRQLADFVTLQQHADFYYEALAERSRVPWPVFNSEFGYEHGPAGLEADLARFTTGTDPAELAHRACEVLMAGAYPAYYYNHTAWDVVDYSHIPPGYSYMRILRDFFTSIPWWQMEPHPEVVTRSVRCLAIPGKQYVFYFPKGARARIVPANKERMDGEWVNLLTGARMRLEGPVAWRATAPTPDAPWILHLKERQ